MNICGLLVHVLPKRLADARALLSAIDGAEVHAAGSDGRLVVTVEDTPARRADQIIMDLHQIPGVVSVTLSYHHFEPLAAPAAVLQN